MRVLKIAIQFLATVAILSAGWIGIWALVIVAFQAIGWLHHGIWQSIPAVALFLTPRAQLFYFQAFPGKDNALRLVPSFANMDSPDQVANSISAGMVGVERIVAWFLDLGLVAWMAVACLLLALLYVILVGNALLIADAAEGPAKPPR